MLLRADLPGVCAGFTTRAQCGDFAGNLAYHVGDRAENVDHWRAELERQVGPLSWMTQVHGTTVIDAGNDTPEADGLVVRRGQGGAVMVADCAPLLLLGTAGAEVTAGAVVHVGRAGLLGGIAHQAVAALRDTGADTVSAVIGPAICGSCYEVGETTAAEAERVLPGSSCVTRWGTPGIDIPASLARQLRESGVDVDVWDMCTMEDERFFSHRRQAGQAGRFAGFLVLNRDTPDRLDLDVL